MKKIDSLEALHEEQQALERQMEMTRQALSKQTKLMGQRIKKDLVSKVLIPAGGTAALAFLLKQGIGSLENNTVTNQVKAGSNNGVDWSRWIKIGLSLFRAWQTVGIGNKEQS